VRHVASYKCVAKLDKILLNCKKWAEFQSKGKKIKAVFEEKRLKCIRIREKSLSLGRLGGEIPSRRCISFYFALNPKDLRNLFGIVRFNCGGNGHKLAPLYT
jgi:hypothetical protein